jgi:hypothetical protein
LAIARVLVSERTAFENLQEKIMDFMFFGRLEARRVNHASLSCAGSFDCSHPDSEAFPVQGQREADERKSAQEAHFRRNDAWNMRNIHVKSIA